MALHPSGSTRGQSQPQSFPPQQERLSSPHTNGALADLSNLIPQSVETAADTEYAYTSDPV
jgi:hypothetical protein